ncbi:hypothetical protein ACIQYJ_31205 [Methylobacterium fujisawaense]|uniref:hypothetical protein n=1 Tax=Methylobacterium fujisawaense TaxID=107400 RepID=UPI00383BE0A4
MSAGYLYEVASYQGLLDILMRMFSRGYYYYHVVELPEAKREKWSNIDQKLIKKYLTDQSKFQRYRRKKNYNAASFFYVRWNELSFILHTDGEVLDDIDYSDKFLDIRVKPLKIPVSTVVFVMNYFHYDKKMKEKITKKGGNVDEKNAKVTVHLSEETRKGHLDVLYHVFNTMNKRKVIHEFEKMNGYPCWRGIVAQKRAIQHWMFREAEKRGIPFTDEEKKSIRFTDKRKPVSIYKEPVE